jgi:signal transduction histidine kinase
MKRTHFFLWVLAGAAAVAISLFGFFNLLGRPRLPAFPHEGGPPARVLRVDSFAIQNEDDFDFVLSGKRIGQTVEVELARGERREVIQAKLAPYYARDPLVFLLIGAFAIVLGFLVFFLRSADRHARIFYCATLAFSTAVLVNGDVYGVHDRGLSLIPGVLFNFAYPLAPALLWRFNRALARLKEKRGFQALWAIPLVLGAFLNFGFLHSQLKPSIAAFRAYERDFFVFRWYVIIVCLAAVAELVRAFRRSISEEVRAQVKWIFYGLTIGLAPFLFAYELPPALGLKPLLSENLTSAFFFFVPLSLAIAIMKYRLMHINLVINKSLVYSLLTMFTVGIYLLSVEILGRLFARTAPVRGSWIPLAGAVVAAVVFQPGRRRIQLLVDRTFFRQSFDYREATLKFGTKAQRAMDRGGLVALFTAAVRETLPLEEMGVLAYEPADDGPRFFVREEIDEAAGRAICSLKPPLGEAWARENAVRTTRGLDFTREDLLQEFRLQVVIPLPFGSETMGGCLALGRKKSGLRFTRDDLDLLETLAADLAAGLERIRLQEEVVYERASREKAVELNELKTEFISSVSHELRTPMTSIQSLSELLRSGKVGDEARRERLLHLLAGECGRLSRFVHNVLDFGKIEKDTQVYDLRPAALQPIILEAAELCRSSVASGDLDLRVEVPDAPVVVGIDQDAVRQALLNLVDNAVKYSGPRKEITLRLLEREAEVEIQVEDRGIGIEPENRDKIFEAFFRSPRAVERDSKGVGLGLKIAKHIIDGHGGRIGLRSEPGKGSTFGLIFPRRRTE